MRPISSRLCFLAGRARILAMRLSMYVSTHVTKSLASLNFVLIVLGVSHAEEEAKVDVAEYPETSILPTGCLGSNNIVFELLSFDLFFLFTSRSDSAWAAGAAAAWAAALPLLLLSPQLNGRCNGLRSPFSDKLKAHS